MASQRYGALSGAPVVETDGQTLVARIRAGDAAAFETMFVAYYQTLYAFAYRYLGAREPAEDVVQDVFRNVWFRRSEWAPRADVGSYLVTATRNQCLNVIRHAAVARAHEGSVAVTTEVPGLGVAPVPPDEEIVTAELTLAIETAASELAPRCREVFLRRWREGQSIAETAKLMGISPKTVEMQMTRALVLVRERVREHLSE
jgi:RNA polymerase sigma-70 factor (ECF subfamily)